MEAFLFATLLTCLGTEPFWALKISPDQISLATYPQAERQIEPVKAQAFAGMADGYAMTYSTRFTDTHEPVTLVVKENKNCSDGMSDNSYEYEVFIVSPEGPNYYGCCNKRSD